MDLTNIYVKPITNQQEFQEAGDLIDRLIDADLIEDEQERQKALNLLEAITILACEYEKKHFSIPKPEPIAAIKERMEQLNLSPKDVAPFFGSESKAFEVLNGKRNLSVKMIRALYLNLKIPLETLLELRTTSI